MSNPQPVPGEQRGFELKLNHNGSEHSIKFLFDLSLYSHQNIAGFLTNNQLYEPGSSQVLLQLLKPGDTFIDIGAHIGYFTMLASRLVGPTGRVYAFEPENANYHRLMVHLQINEMTNVLPFKWAASNTTSVVNLRTDPGNDGGHAIWNLEARHTTDEGRAKIMLQPTFSLPLDSLFRGAGPGAIKGIKVDTEGFELQVLNGMRNLLDQAKVPVVICEINHTLLPFTGASEQNIRDFMLGLGYRIYFDNPETGALSPLEPTQKAETKYVYNLIFIRPEVIQEGKPPETPAPTPAG